MANATHYTFAGNSKAARYDLPNRFAQSRKHFKFRYLARYILSFQTAGQGFTASTFEVFQIVHEGIRDTDDADTVTSKDEVVNQPPLLEIKISLSDLWAGVSEALSVDQTLKALIERPWIAFAFRFLADCQPMAGGRHFSYPAGHGCESVIARHSASKSWVNGIESTKPPTTRSAPCLSSAENCFQAVPAYI